MTKLMVSSVGAVAVLGTGRTGPTVAAALTASGRPVVIVGRRPEAARAAAAAASALSGAHVGHRPLEEASFADVTTVVETIVEDLLAKRELLAQVEAWVGEDCLIATNTSSLSVTAIAAALRRPERVAGMHFLHPAHLSGLTEVMPGEATSPEALRATEALVVAAGKRPLMLGRDVPGFLWNRVQAAVLRECVHLLETGVADAAAIDAAVSDALAPRWLAAGPLATRDLGGRGTFAALAEQLFPQLASDAAPSPALAGPDFYVWTDGSRAAVEELRAETIRTGRAVAERRRPATPSPVADTTA